MKKNQRKYMKLFHRVASALFAAAFFVMPLSACGTANGNNGGNGTSQTITDTETGKYSKLLQSVLTSDYYNDIIAKAKSGEIPWNLGYFVDKPYGFLEQQGFDLYLLKSSQLKSSCKSFVLESEPNNLYMAVKAQKYESDDFYYEYMIKYTLTNKEMEDYNMVYDNKYIQSSFMNEEISRQKTPEILSVAKMGISAHTQLEESLSALNESKTFLDTPKVGILLKNFDIEAKTFDVYAFPDFTGGSTLSKNVKAGIYPLQRGLSPKLKINNNIFYGPTEIFQFGIQSDFDINSSVNAKVFCTLTARFQTEKDNLVNPN